MSRMSYYSGGGDGISVKIYCSRRCLVETNFFGVSEIKLKPGPPLQALNLLL